MQPLNISAYGHTIGVFSDESAHLFAMISTDLCTELFVGAKYFGYASIDSGSDNDHYRFSLSPDGSGAALWTVLDRQGEQARESGFFARCLLSEPQPRDHDFSVMSCRQEMSMPPL